jgi:hypothetical protein
MTISTPESISTRRIESGPLASAPYSPPIDLHEGVIQAIDGYAEFEGYLAPARNAFSTAFEALKAINEARVAAEKNRARTPQQIVLITASFAEKKLEHMTRIWDKARADLQASAMMLDESLSAPLEQQAMGPINAEIRAHIKAMDSTERVKFIQESINSKRVKVISAVLGAESFLSGLSDGMHTSFTRIWHEQEQPAAVRRLAATRKALEQLDKRGGLALTQVEKAMGGTWKEVKALRGMVAEEEKAFAR